MCLNASKLFVLKLCAHITKTGTDLSLVGHCWNTFIVML